MSQQSTDSDVRVAGGDHGRPFETDTGSAEDIRRARTLVHRAYSSMVDPNSDVTAAFAQVLTLLDTLDSTTSTAAVQATHRDQNAIETLETLGDSGCRAIIDATRTRALTVSEIEERCNIPCSTAYRKLDRLTVASLLDTDVRIGSDGPHATEYQPAVTDVLISLEPTPTATLWNRTAVESTLEGRADRELLDD